MSDEKRPTIAGDLRRFRRHAAVAGIVLAILCNLVPAEYRTACDVIASLCTGKL